VVVLVVVAVILTVEDDAAAGGDERSQALTSGAHERVAGGRLAVHLQGPFHAVPAWDVVGRAGLGAGAAAIVTNAQPPA
jgi:hypothetical protein